MEIFKEYKGNLTIQGVIHIINYIFYKVKIPITTELLRTKVENIPSKSTFFRIVAK
jgi:hypothetical protein